MGAFQSEVPTWDPSPSRRISLVVEGSIDLVNTMTRRVVWEASRARAQSSELMCLMLSMHEEPNSKTFGFDLPIIKLSTFVRFGMHGIWWVSSSLNRGVGHPLRNIGATAALLSRCAHAQHEAGHLKTWAPLHPVAP